MNGGSSGFRGLLCPPRTEFEVIAVFGLLLPYLEDDFVLKSYGGGFPDAVLLRNGEEVRAEFEVYTSSFFEHGHHEDSRVRACSLIVAWENNLPERTERGVDGREYLWVTENHRVEVLELRRVVERLKRKGRKLLMSKTCPGIAGGEEEFFSQLRVNVDEERYKLIKELYEYVRARSGDFEVVWGHGKRWYTMRIRVRRWDVNPITVEAGGLVWINYTGNPAQKNYWELPEETAERLRRLFGHSSTTRWKTIPLNTSRDLRKLEEALGVLAEHSRRFKLVLY